MLLYLSTCYIGVRSGMAVELPLPELTDANGKEGFLHAWTRLELIAAAKEWDEEKQLKVLPTMLRGKLLDTYIEPYRRRESEPR